MPNGRKRRRFSTDRSEWGSECVSEGVKGCTMTGKIPTTGYKPSFGESAEVPSAADSLGDLGLESGIGETNV